MTTPSDILELFTAHWTSAITASAVELGIFTELDRGSRTVAELAKATSAPERSIQAVMDGLVVASLVTTEDGVRYFSTPSASAHLVSGRAGYLGSFARILTGSGDGGMRQWSMLPNALRAGHPIAPETIVDPDSPFWPELVRALTPLSREVAAIAARAVGLDTRGATSVLDIGGGAGAYASVWLKHNPNIRVTQVDWAPVNAIARAEVERDGLGSRFRTIDGDFHMLPLGSREYDFVIVSNICHHESPAGNVTLFKRVADALARDGRIVVSDFVLHDDRRGPAFAARFGAGMVLQTPEGQSYRECDYQTWLAQAGFGHATVDRSHALSALLIAGLAASNGTP